MIAPLAKFIDWSALQVLTRRIPAPCGNMRLEEAKRFINGLDFIPEESQPAKMEFNDSLHFSFPTPRPCDLAENNIVYGRLYRATKHWQNRPTVVLLHGWNSTLSHRYRFPLIARNCNHAGFNTATLEQPYHFQRRSRGNAGLNRADYLRMAERTAQAVAEIRSLTGWLLEQGCPSVALWGSSWGGWLAGLTICRDPRLKAVVMAVPKVRNNPSRVNRIIWRRSREMLRGQLGAMSELDETALNLTTGQPVIPKEKILLVEAIHDLFGPRESVEELWQKWGQPDIWRVPHGHFSFGLIGAPCLMAHRVVQWLSPRMNK